MYTERNFVGESTPRRALVTGGGGFIGGHLIRDLVGDGYAVAALDIKPIERWHQVHSGVLNLPLTDVSDTESFKNALAAADEVYHLAANMGGMGFVESHRVECASDVAGSVRLLNALSPHQRVFFASSACVYPQRAQRGVGGSTLELAEHMAYPADPEPGYGWAKLYTEQLLKYHREERGLDVRIARFHNVYGPNDTWTGGREKAPAAICRKIAVAAITGDHKIEIWGDGTQTRSFTYIDDNVHGIRDITESNYTDPVNLGTSRLVTMNDLVDAIIDVAFDGAVHFKRVYNTSAPKGVQGRNSDNTLFRSLTGWEPGITLHDGITLTYPWIYDQVIRSINK